MIKSKALILALLSLALGMQAGAVPVTSAQATVAARAWIRQGGRLAPRPGEIERTTALSLTGDGCVFAVKVRNGGTVLVSSDTDREPIIAFTPSPVELRSIDPASPLAALLTRDLALRRRVAEVAAATGGQSVQTSHRRWSALLDSADALPGAAPLAGGESPDDLRVAPLTETKWGQDEMAIEGSDEVASCFNCLTPHQYFCGCVATAMAQTMRYHRWPVEPIAVFSNKCTVTGWSMWLETSGVAYDWANMPALALSSDPTLRAAQCEAIGQLTYECGIAVQMDYGPSGSGAMTEDVVGALKSRFDYAQALWCDDSTGISFDEKVRERILYTSLDAGSPVILSIDGESGGHAVVGDGYGFCTVNGSKIPYVHLNMGWTGENDWWYNLPEINCSDNPEDFEGFDLVKGAVYGVFPDRTGRIVSGRVLGADGTPAAGVEVRFDTFTAPTDENGVYRFVFSEEDLTNGVYRVGSSSGDGVWLGEIYVKLGDDNSWGNDIRLRPPTVVLNGAQKFASLDSALIVASEGVVEATQRFEIYGPAEFREAEWRIGYDAVFVAAAPEASIVRSGDGVLIAAEDGRLTFDGIAFAEAKGPSVRLESGTKAVLLGAADLGEVCLEEGSVLDLGEFDGSHALVVDTPGRAAEGVEFSRFAGDLGEMPTLAGLIVCKTDESLAAAVVDRGGGFVALTWAHVDSVHELASIVSLTQGGETTYYRSLGAAFRAIGGPAEILVRKDCTLGLGDALTVSDELTIRSEGFNCIEPAEPAKTMASAISVVADGTLTVSNLVFSGFTVANPFVYVYGGEFILEDSMLEGISSSHTTYGSPVTIDNGGRFSMRQNSMITGCSAVKGNGGAVRFIRGGCTMEIEDSTIIYCSAAAGNGSVYVAKGAELRVSTGSWIRDSTGINGQRSDIYLANGAVLTVAGPLTDWASIGVCGIAKTWMNAGIEFARLADGLELDAHELDSTAQAFVNERADMELIAVPNAAGTGFVWAESEFGWLQPLDPEDWDGPDAIAKVIYPDGSVKEWGATQWAFESLLAYDPASEATVILLQHDYFDENIVVSNHVKLVSEPSEWFRGQYPDTDFAVLMRTQGFDITVAKGAALTIGNLALSGVFMSDDEPSGALIKVNGGSLTLDDGAVLMDVRGTGSRAASAVVVWNKGEFTMLPGALVSGCSNDYVNVTEGTGVGAGVLVDDGEAYLYGGTVTGCTAYKGAGVFIGNKANVHVKGDFCVYGNEDFKGDASNLYVSDQSDLYLEGPLDRSVYQLFFGIGYTEGVRADQAVFGRLSETYPETLEDAAFDASLFVHDLTQDNGILVTNETEALLVWGRGLAADGTYTDADGSVYGMVDRGYDIIVGPPDPIPLVYDGKPQTGVAEGPSYTITGNVGTNAGAYTAVLTLKPGYTWLGGGPDPLEIEWTIAKAVYDLSGVKFEDKTYMADGTRKRLEISGRLPPGVTVSYEGNGQAAPGTFTVTAKFTGDATNYEPIPAMTATLTITGTQPTPPDPPDEPEIVHPAPIAFRSIEKTGEGEWTLVVTNIVPYCNYRLLSTDDLSQDFTEVVPWTPAAADAPAAWTNVIRTTDGARFWSAEAKDGEKPASK